MTFGTTICPKGFNNFFCELLKKYQIFVPGICCNSDQNHVQWLFEMNQKSISFVINTSKLIQGIFQVDICAFLREYELATYANLTLFTAHFSFCLHWPLRNQWKASFRLLQTMSQLPRPSVQTWTGIAEHVYWKKIYLL